jgi:hypothetical protein
MEWSAPLYKRLQMSQDECSNNIKRERGKP